MVKHQEWALVTGLIKRHDHFPMTDIPILAVEERTIVVDSKLLRDLVLCCDMS